VKRNNLYEAVVLANYAVNKCLMLDKGRLNHINQAIIKFCSHFQGSALVIKTVVACSYKIEHSLIMYWVFLSVVYYEAI